MNECKHERCRFDGWMELLVWTAIVGGMLSNCANEFRLDALEHPAAEASK